ncbi:MAG TPA: FkbM family methyltransferase [Planctomycetes bacterium]|nr:FkbM family methyltransferase [Planctomycetota bacterium]
MTRQSSSSRRAPADNDEMQFTALNNGRIRVDTSEEFLPEFLIMAREALQSGRIDEARELINDDNIKIAREMVEKNPSRMAVMYILAMTLVGIGRLAAAEEWYLKILERNPHWAVYNELANIKEKTGRRTEAMEYRRKALEANPDSGVLLNNYGMDLARMGETQQGIDLLRKAQEKIPDFPVIHSNLLFFMHYMPDSDCQLLFDEHKRWARMQGPTTLARTSHDNVPDPDRRLRIGYISPDFRSHSVAYFFEILLDECNHEAVENYGYSNVEQPDKVTERLKFKFDHFRNTYSVSDEAVVEMIEKDKIDILVDLAGHTGNNRLPVLAHKPAPIQVTYLGYPDTTGMEQIDYRLTDELADPPESQQFYTEELLYLPDGFLCYKPAGYAPPVAPLPVLKNGYITFGSFNNNCKVNPFIMSIWAEVLKVNDNSRFVMKFKGGHDETLRDYYLRKFEELGINTDRIDIHGVKRPVEHLKLYNQIDIALDTYPYNGTTTTFEALWMGVPVISLVGQHHMSRVGSTILTRFGMGFLAADTPENYLIRATALAAKTDTLAGMRAIMRRTIAGASLCNTNKFVRNVEAAYQQMWRRWCRSRDVEVPGEASRVEDQRSGADAAEHSLDTDKQKTSPAVQGAAREPNSARLSHIAKLAVLADNLYRTGHRKLAANYAVEGWHRLYQGEKAGDIPQQILLNWNVREEKALFVHLCISLIGYSSYYNPSPYRRLFLNWVGLEPFNPEPHLRFGLLLALDAKRKAITSPPASLKALRHAESMMRSERSAAALALAERDLTELSLPYDGGRIHVYPDLRNVTTYVLLEQGDWFEHDDLSLFRTLIRPGDKVLDLGANVGVYAISAVLRTGSQGRVVAVEPTGETFELLNKSASAFKHMTAVRAAVSDKSGTGSLLPGRTPEDNKLAAGQEQGEKVDVFSVDDLAARTGVDCFDIIKMDVEGHEQQTLAGAQKIIGENSPIIFYEIKEGSNLHTELIDVFHKLGYDSYYYVGSTSTLVKFRKGQELDAYLLNMVAVRPESLHRFDGLVHIADVPSEQPGADVRRSGTGKAVDSPQKTMVKHSKRKIDAKRIFISSMARSGSMWTYNVTRSLIRAAGMEPLPKNVPVNEKPFINKALNETLSEKQVYCVKTHYRVNHKLPDTLIIVTYRDIRDAVFSYMKFMGLSFEEAFQAPKRWMVLTDTYFENQSPNILKIRYDEIVNEPMDTIQKIDRFIGTGASFETIEKINEEFSRKKMKEKVDGLKDISPEQVRVNAAAFDTVENAGGIVRVLDRATGFQTGHVSFRKDGQWREDLTEEQKQHLMRETADWLQRHGFKL